MRVGTRSLRKGNTIIKPFIPLVFYYKKKLLLKLIYFSVLNFWTYFFYLSTFSKDRTSMWSCLKFDRFKTFQRVSIIKPEAVHNIVGRGSRRRGGATRGSGGGDVGGGGDQLRSQGKRGDGGWCGRWRGGCCWTG